MINIGIVDDHQLFMKSLGALMEDIADLNVCVEALNGKDLIARMATVQIIPDILLIDVNMPVMDGRTTALHIHEHYPQIKMIALSMKDDDITVVSMLRAGCCAYLLKDIHPDELEKAIHEVDKYGYYNADISNINFRRLLLHAKQEEQFQLTDREKQFIQLACSDRTYKQIASEMNISERTVDGYREALFLKLNVQSRVGLALEAIRKHLAIL